MAPGPDLDIRPRFQSPGRPVNSEKHTSTRSPAVMRQDKIYFRLSVLIVVAIVQGLIFWKQITTGLSYRVSTKQKLVEGHNQAIKLLKEQHTTDMAALQAQLDNAKSELEASTRKLTNEKHALKASRDGLRKKLDDLQTSFKNVKNEIDDMHESVGQYKRLWEEHHYDMSTDWCVVAMANCSTAIRDLLEHFANVTNVTSNATSNLQSLLQNQDKKIADARIDSASAINLYGHLAEMIPSANSIVMGTAMFVAFSAITSAITNWCYTTSGNRWVSKIPWKAFLHRVMQLSNEAQQDQQNQGDKTQVQRIRSGTMLLERPSGT